MMMMMMMMVVEVVMMVKCMTTTKPGQASKARQVFLNLDIPNGNMQL